MPISVRLCSANEILHANRCQAQLWKRPARLGAAFPRVSDRFFFIIVMLAGGRCHEAFFALSVRNQISVRNEIPKRIPETRRLIHKRIKI